MNSIKKQLGQFFTTNSDYILEGLQVYIKSKKVTDPFAGSRDLMSWAKKHGAKSVFGFDVDKKYADGKIVKENDSLNNPYKYNFVITNPPYLHKNKADKNTKELYFSGENSYFEDLYQVSLKSILNSEEGIIIVPLNFLSAENSEKIRNIFFDKFDIVKLNIFNQQVFDDTTYNVISFYYRKKIGFRNKIIVDTNIFPEKTKISFELSKDFGWQLGGEFISRINLAKNVLGIYRLTTDRIKNGPFKIKMAFNNIKDIEEYPVDKDFKNSIENNIIFLRAIDSKNGKKIQLEDIRKYKVHGLVGKNTSRNMAHLFLSKSITINEQGKLVRYFNEELEKARKEYMSLFLTNFRDNNRKRISFEFAYKLLNYVYIDKLCENTNGQLAFN